MREYNKERVDELIIDEWIWGVFIILSILNICGDELEKKYCYFHDRDAKIASKKIFKLTVFSSFLIYFYLAYKNCKKYYKIKAMNEKNYLVCTRCIASIFVVIASFLFLTAQLSDDISNSPSLQ